MYHDFSAILAHERVAQRGGVQPKELRHRYPPCYVSPRAETRGSRRRYRKGIQKEAVEEVEATLKIIKTTDCIRSRQCTTEKSYNAWLQHESFYFTAPYLRYQFQQTKQTVAPRYPKISQSANRFVRLADAEPERLSVFSRRHRASD